MERWCASPHESQAALTVPAILFLVDKSRPEQQIALAFDGGTAVIDRVDRAGEFDKPGAEVLLGFADEEIFLDLGRMHFEQREEELAIKVLESAMSVFRLSPLQPAYFDLLAKSYQRAGDTPRERQTLQELLTLLCQREVTHVTGDGKQVVIRMTGMLSAVGQQWPRDRGTHWMAGASWQGFARAISTTKMPTVEQVEERLRKLK